MTSDNKEIVTGQQNNIKNNLPATTQRQYRLPAADVYETSEAYVLMIDLPGASKENVAVRIENGELRVRADVVPFHENGAVILHREHVADGYDRAFSLGEDIDTGSVDAQFDNGVLILTLLKAERVKAREITIR